MAGQQFQDKESSSDQEGQLSLQAVTNSPSRKPIMATIFIERKRLPWKSTQEQGSAYFLRAPGDLFSKFVNKKPIVLLKT